VPKISELQAMLFKCTAQGNKRIGANIKISPLECPDFWQKAAEDI